MSSCICPDLEPVSSVPAAPLTCGCCGKPLELTCAGQCGPAHVRAAFKLPKPAKLPKLPRVKAEPRPPAPWLCGRCGGEIPKKLGRAPKYCMVCRTPEELARLERQTAANEAARRKRLEVAP